jgi:RHS repeat-associated protein
VKVGADYQYDAAGNMTYDAVGQYYGYDQENRISGAGGFTYTYDAEGNRVEKSNGSTGTLYWYMSPGIVAESDLSGNLQSEYVFFGGARVARKDFPGTAVSYYFSDHLKTTDIVTDAQGNIKSESDFNPWGGELQFLNSDSNHYKFTGKERDSETQLDYFGARYYSNGLGRFITPDWAAKPAAVPYAVLGDPQSLNLYTYVRNVPTTGIDVDGHKISHELDNWSPLDAGPLADEGGPSTTYAARMLAWMSSSAFGWELEAQQAQNQSQTQTPSQTQQDRHLGEDEKRQLSWYLPEIDLNNAVIHVGKTPHFGLIPFPFPENADAVTVHNNIFVRKSAYDPGSPEFLDLLAHEIFHVGQYRTHQMTVTSYLREAAQHGGGENNKYERPAYEFGRIVYRHLTSYDGTYIERPILP